MTTTSSENATADSDDRRADTSATTDTATVDTIQRDGTQRDEQGRLINNGIPTLFTDEQIAKAVDEAYATESAKDYSHCEQIEEVPPIADPKGRLLVVDGHSLAFRAWYAYPADSFSDGQGHPTNAVYGFFKMLSSVVAKEKPTHIGVAFDVRGGTFRNRMLGGYKGTREKAPDEFLEQIPRIQEVLEALNIPHIEKPGYEGDDVIASLALKGERAGYQVLVLSGDRDSFQLVDSNVTVLYPGQHMNDLQHMTPEAVEAKYKVSPHQYPEIAALRGETSDNIPGVPGVGDGYAAKWINQYGGLDGIIAHADEIGGKKGEALRENLDQVRLNRRVNAVRRHLDLPVTFDQLQTTTFDQDQLDTVLDSLKFGVRTRRELISTFSARSGQKAVLPALGAGVGAGVFDDGSFSTIEPRQTHVDLEARENADGLARLSAWFDVHPSAPARRMATGSRDTVEASGGDDAAGRKAVTAALGVEMSDEKAVGDALIVLFVGDPHPGAARLNALEFLAPDGSVARLDLHHAADAAAGFDTGGSPRQQTLDLFGDGDDDADMGGGDDDGDDANSVLCGGDKDKDTIKTAKNGGNAIVGHEKSTAQNADTSAAATAASVEATVASTKAAATAAETFSVSAGAGRHAALAALLRRVLAARAFLVWGFKENLILARLIGVELPDPVFDARLAAYLVRPDQSPASVELAAAHLLTTVEEPVKEKKTRKKPTPEEIEAARKKQHAEELARPALVEALAKTCARVLDARGQAGLLADIEVPSSRVLAGMEQEGIAVDADRLEQVRQGFETAAAQAQQEAYDFAGQDGINLQSPQQLQKVLFEDMGLVGTRKTKRGWSTDATELDKLLERYINNEQAAGFLVALKRYREQNKLASMVETLQQTVNPEDGRIHTTYEQTIAATGRLSSTDPNLQNIPNRSEDGRRIRSAFVAGQGFENLLSCDYSQVELRLMAHFSGDEALIEAFNSGADFHKYVASLVFGKPVEQITASERTHVKAMSYGLAYGLSTFGLAQRLEVSPAQASVLRDKYFATFGKVRDYLDDLVAQAKKTGYTTTMFGRRRYFPGLRARNRMVREAAQRAALNAPIQGSAADIMKLAMIRAQRGLDAAGVRSRLLLQIHDELVVGIAPGEEKKVTAIITDAMENAVHLSVPLTVSTGVGPDWQAAAH